jgi:hypothetical protein
MAKRLDILVLDEDPQAACTVAKHLREHHQIRIALDHEEAGDEMKRRMPDLVVCSLELLTFVVERPDVHCVLYAKPPRLEELLDAIEGYT